MPVILIELLKRFWWAIPMLALSGVAFVYKTERNHARTELAVARADAAHRDAVAALAAAEALKHSQEAAELYESTAKAAQLFGASLSERVRYYENRLRASAVPQTAGSAAPAAGSDAIPEAIGQAIAACARDDAKLEALQNFYK